MHFAQVIHTESHNIHLVLCAIKNAKKSILTHTAILLDATNAQKQEAHGKLKNVFRRNNMKKSEHYHLAQIAVVTSPCIEPENKLKVLRTLIAQENLELYCESRETEGEE